MNNANCTICSDIFTPTSEIFTTTCGHLFHYACLMQWLERSHTCPQCRHKTNISNIHRIFCNYSNIDGTTADSSTLQNRLDDLQFQMKLKEQGLKNSEEKRKTLKTQNFGLREMVKHLEDKEKATQSAMLGIKDQLAYLKNKSKETDKLNNEVQKLKSELDQLESIKIVLSESQSKVDDLLKQCKEPNQLVILVSVLKKELSDLERKKKRVIGDLHTKIIGYKNQISQQKKTIIKLEHELEKCRSVEHKSVKHVVKEQSPDLNSKTEIRKENPQLDDSLNDSRFINLLINKTASPITESPLVEKVKSIVEADSPYLPVEYSAINVSCHSGLPKSSRQQFSIFKRPEKIQSAPIAPPDVTYNGLGGHSREEYCFSPSNKPNLKRRGTASSGSSLSSKFRKLAPNKKT